MLEIVAKCENELFKKLSYFRLEIYKKYGALHTAKIKTVENSVESVEFHPKSRREHWIFEHFPRTFQHVEKIEGIWTRMWKTFAEEKITEKMPTLCPDKIPVQKKPGIL